MHAHTSTARLVASGSRGSRSQPRYVYMISTGFSSGKLFPLHCSSFIQGVQAFLGDSAYIGMVQYAMDFS